MPDPPDTGADEAIVAYVRGRLPTDETARLEAEAARHPGLAADIALTRSIASALDAEAAMPGPGELGWARLSRALDTEATRPARSRLFGLWPLAASAVAAVVLWQVVAVPLLAPFDDEAVGYSPASEQPAASLRLTVAFVPGATEAEIRELLEEVGARITDGPSAIGLWQVTFQSASMRDVGQARMQLAAIVDSAEVR